MKSERGSATMVVLTLLAVLSILATVNGDNLRRLRVELHRLDRQQQERFQKSGK